MKRSEEKALATYKVREKTNLKGTGSYDPNLPRRKAFTAGYEEGVNDVLDWLENNLCHYLYINRDWNEAQIKEICFDDLKKFLNNEDI